VLFVEVVAFEKLTAGVAVLAFVSCANRHLHSQNHPKYFHGLHLDLFTMPRSATQRAARNATRRLRDQKRLTFPLSRLPPELQLLVLLSRLLRCRP
jgi:hypothetical protein